MVQIYKAQKKTPPQNQIIKVKIDRLDVNGVGVGTAIGYGKNKPVFISGTLPDELVSVKIIEEKSKFIKGHLLNVVQQSPYRVPPHCQHFDQCGGCDLQHLALDEQLTFKQHKIVELFARNTITESLPWQSPIKGEAWHYRRKARIGVQYNKQGQATIGFRSKGSNTVLSIKSCPVLEQSLSDVFKTLKALFNRLPRAMSVGHIEVIKTDEINLIVRLLKPFNDVEHTLWKTMVEAEKWQLFIDNGETIQKVVFNEIVDTNLSLNTTLTYSLIDDIVIDFKPDDFIQVNHQVNIAMVEQALDWLSLTETDHVLDLFCGLGNFSLPIAKRVQKVVGVEGVQDMVNRASENAIRNHITNCQFYQADLNSQWQNFPWQQEKFTKIVLDPARAGALMAVEQLASFNVDMILYVSCEPSSLAEDSNMLISLGYKIKKIAIMDMFSQTKHIETMVLFTK